MHDYKRNVFMNKIKHTGQTVYETCKTCNGTGIIEDDIGFLYADIVKKNCPDCAGTGKVCFSEVTCFIKNAQARRGKEMLSIHSYCIILTFEEHAFIMANQEARELAQHFVQGWGKDGVAMYTSSEHLNNELIKIWKRLVSDQY